MSLSEKPLDLELWLNKDVIQRQNLLKTAFNAILEEVANSIAPTEFSKISTNSRGIKLSKGNDLLRFPYFVLDIIRDFDPVNGVNIRVLNWFGHGLYITVLLGEKRINPVDRILNSGFSYGLSVGKWDYPDLIVNQNLTKDSSRIQSSQFDFHHWIKELSPDSNPKLQVEALVTEIKNLLGIMSLPKKRVSI